MSTENVKRKVSELLKKCYPDIKPRLKLLKISQDIAKQIEDPLLWVRLYYPTQQDGRSVVKRSSHLKQIEKLKLPTSEEVISTRLKALEDCNQLKSEHDRPVPGKDYDCDCLFKTVIQVPRVVEQAIVCRPPTAIPATLQTHESKTASQAPESTKSGMGRPGVVIDLYATSRMGYVCSLEGNRNGGQVEAYGFDYAAVAESTAQLPLHVGDVVSFQVGTSDRSRGQIISLTLTEFLPGVLERQFLDSYFEALDPSHPIVPLPVWMALVNEKRFYHMPNLLHRVLAMGTQGTCRLDSDHMKALSQSSLVKDMVLLLERDVRRNNPSDSKEYQEYTEDMHAAVGLLATLIQQFPETAYMLAAPVKHATQLPETLVGQEIKRIAQVLIKAFPAPSQACDSLEVLEYFPGVLSPDDACNYMAAVIQSEADDITVIHRILQSPACWVAILNDPRLYQKFFHEILDVHQASKISPPKAVREFMKTFRGSSFIRDIPRLFDEMAQTTTPPQPRCSPANYSTSATRLLADLLQYVPEEGKRIGEMLGNWLDRLVVHEDIECLTQALVVCHLSPPPCLDQHSIPWNCVPTIPTVEEFELAVKQVQQGQLEGRYQDLPVVKDRGSYESVDEYGQTYFTLLREDCYGELFNTIAQLKAHVDPTEQTIVYYHVEFVGLARGRGDRLVFNLVFKSVQLPRNSFTEDSMLLREGNLVGLSVEGRFENDVLWATIDHSQRVSVTEQNDMIQFEASLLVQFCSDENHLPGKAIEQLKHSRNTVAVESPAYFKAYQPVLNAIKAIDVERIHFREDLLDPSHEVKCAPVIVNDESTVDPSAVYYPSELARGDPTRMKVRDLKQDLESDDAESKHCLDESQRSAVRSALSQPLTVIQGPPGTGKTYVGLKLLELFLTLDTLPKGKPVLVMAYKNRALDRFIDQCQSFCSLSDVVRIGHVSDGYDRLSETLLSKKVRRLRQPNRSQLNTLYQRIRDASKDVAVFSQFSLESVRLCMTCEWLQYLLLGGDARECNLTPGLRHRLQCDPGKCLDLLQSTSVLGFQDQTEQGELKEAFRLALEAWTEDDNFPLSPVPVKAKTSRVQQHCADGELAHEEEVRERQLASDDFDDTTASGCEPTIEFPEVDMEYPNEAVQNEGCIDLWKLSAQQRRARLMSSLVLPRYKEALENMKDAVAEYSEALQHYEWEREALSLKVLRKAKVVAMTTTGAAINQQLLNRLEAPVVFVEEAAEVLEANLLACLTPHVKHLILIGDHMQLKPALSCRRLKKQKLNVSMFERLVNNSFPYVLLMRQSRMHPDLIRLFSYHYPAQKEEAGYGLRNNLQMVQHLERPSCMATSFYWWTHSELEEWTGTSVVNRHEVKMVTSLCLWLLTQDKAALSPDHGYLVTVLTPYRAQLKLISDELQDQANQRQGEFPEHVLTRLARIGVSTVDEFQSHESGVVILSLVRSNMKGRIGFLSEKNRLVVGTSRQKRALYIVGDAAFLTKNSPIVWKKFIDKLKHQVQISSQIPVMHEGEKYDLPDVTALEDAAKDPRKLRPHSAPGKLKTAGELQKQHSSPGKLESAVVQSENESDSFRKLILKLKDIDGVITKWKHIARRLEVSEMEIDCIEGRQQDDKAERFYQMLRKWRQVKGKAATYQELEKALREEKLTEAADEVARQSKENV